MRVLAILGLVAVISVNSYSVLADEFGPRFFAKAPAALGDYTAPAASVQNVAVDEQLAKDLQNIMPAAGDEKPEADSPDKDKTSE